MGNLLIWLVVYLPLGKNISQLGLLFQIYGKIKNVPNHQLENVKTTNTESQKNSDFDGDLNLMYIFK